MYNVKRRIASLPPISLDIFRDRVQPKPELVEKESDEESSTDTEEDVVSPRQCLFCPQTFDDDTDDCEDALEHMFTDHGLFIPDHTKLLDIECFLGYLATQVRVWHECLHCGTTRESTLAIQSHMKDSGHCMLNLEREPELLEFWEHATDEEGSAQSEIGRTRMVFGNELQLPSGKVVGSREISQRRTKAMRVRDVRLALRADPHSSQPPEPTKKHGHLQLTRRDEMGIQNINSQQRQALVLAAQRSQKSEEIATRAREWSYARQANSQKHDQAHGSLSWAKGGLHNLLPR